MEDQYLDTSITPKKGEGIVEKAFITQGEEGKRIAKIKIRSQRIRLSVINFVQEQDKGIMVYFKCY